MRKKFFILIIVSIVLLFLGCNEDGLGVLQSVHNATKEEGTYNQMFLGVDTDDTGTYIYLVRNWDVYRVQSVEKSSGKYKLVYTKLVELSTHKNNLVPIAYNDGYLYFGRLDDDAGLFLHGGADGEQTLGADAAAACAALLLQNDDAEALLGSLDGGRQAGVAGAADADVARIGGDDVVGAVAGLFFGDLLNDVFGFLRLVGEGSGAGERARACSRNACSTCQPDEVPAGEFHGSLLGYGLPSPIALSSEPEPLCAGLHAKTITRAGWNRLCRSMVLLPVTGEMRESRVLPVRVSLA